MKQVNPAGIRVYMTTLTDRAIVHDSLAMLAKQHAIQTATFEILGGLHEVELTAYDFVTQTRLPAITLQGALEVVGGHGTISVLNDEPHVHWHVVLSERTGDGVKLIGGHVARAVAFALEITITAYDGAPVQRKPHASTGLNLWDTSDS